MKVESEPGSSAATSRRRRRAMGVVAVALGVAMAAACGDDGSAASAPGVPPRFVDETDTSGLDHVYDGDFPFFVGGGVAAFDCDGDNLHDLYLAGGSEPASLYRNASTIGGEIRFEPVVSPETDLTAVLGAYPLDVDSDGLLDLAVLRHGPDTLLRGQGDCRFEPFGDSLGLGADSGRTTAFSATWERANALPTLAFGRYLLPDGWTCDVSTLVRPDTSDTGYAAPIALEPGYCPLSMLFSDWNRDGQRDLRVSNDRHYYDIRDGSEQLWRVAPGDEPRLYGEGDGWVPLQIWGMGIAGQDLTGDGLPEFVLTSQGDNKMRTLADGPSRPTYQNIALQRGTTAQRPYAGGDVLPSTGWHPEFADVNNDGFLDLLITKGNVEAQPDHATRDPSNLLIGQPDGTFVEGAPEAGMVTYDRTRGAAIVDLNLDGLLDLVMVHRRVPATVWRNAGAGTADEPAVMGNWIAVKIRQPPPNVDAVGAWVEVRFGDHHITREVTVGGGHAGGQAGWLHTGIGRAAEAEVRVQWPDGETGPWMPVEAGMWVMIDRGDDSPDPWTPEG